MRLTVVCPTVKPKHKKVVPVPAPVVPDCKPTYVIRDVKVPVPAPYPVLVWAHDKCHESQENDVGLHLGVGLMARSPYGFGQIGLRYKYRPAYVGFEVFSDLQYGVGLQTLAYVYQGPIVSVHVVDPGVLVPFTSKYLLGVGDVHRHVDLLLGAGVEVKVACHFAVTADWRVGLPDPLYVKDHDACTGSCGQRLEPAHVFGNAFASSQVILGLLIRN
jgi:hypothetical protein